VKICVSNDDTQSPAKCRRRAGAGATEWHSAVAKSFFAITDCVSVISADSQGHGQMVPGILISKFLRNYMY
jgi:hypothetical protein